MTISRNIVNLLIVWMLTGMWHGAAWNFIIWGLYFAIILMIEKLFLLKYLKKSKVLNHIYVLLLVIISFVIFDAASMKDAFSYIGSMFGAGGYPLVSTEFVYYLRSYGVVILLAMIGSTPLPKLVVGKINESRVGGKIMTVLAPVALCVLLAICTACLVDGSYNPFLYFRF